MLTKNYRDLLWELIKTNFKLRYNNSILGFIWVLIKPFATFVILYFVWSALGGSDIENYQVNLLLGIIVFTFVNEGVIMGMNSLLDKAHIILKVNFPRQIAVVSSVSMAIINLVINMLIFAVFCLFNNVSPTLASVGWFILTILIVTYAIYAASLYLSVFVIKLRDLQHVFELLFQLLFWLTPIFYVLGFESDQGGLTVITGWRADLISLNPLGMVVQIARETLINGEVGAIRFWDGEIHSAYILGVLSLVTIFIGVTGKYYFKNQVKKIAEYF